MLLSLSGEYSQLKQELLRLNLGYFKGPISDFHLLVTTKKWKKWRFVSLLVYNVPILHIDEV